MKKNFMNAQSKAKIPTANKESLERENLNLRKKMKLRQRKITEAKEVVGDKNLDHMHMKRNPRNSGLGKIPRDFDWLESPKT